MSRSCTNKEFLRRLAQPEPARSLRLQKERLEHEREQYLRRLLSDIEAKRLREEIKALGGEPCA